MEDSKPLPFKIPKPGPELTAEAMTEQVTDEFSVIHNRLAPMVWALAFDICKEDPSPARMNAVLNSLLTSAAAWTVAVSPPEVTSNSAQADTIKAKFASNLTAMLDEHESVRSDVSQLGHFLGRQLLLEHRDNALAVAVKELVNVLLASRPQPKDG